MLFETSRLFVIEMPPDLIDKRLESDTFVHELRIGELSRQISFDADWPGDAIALLSMMQTNDAIRTSNHIIIHKEHRRAVAMIGTKGPANAEGSVEIGYGTNKSYEGQGLMTEAIDGFCRWLASKGVRSVTAEVLQSNGGSRRVLEKNGFALVGTRFDADEGGVLIRFRNQLVKFERELTFLHALADQASATAMRYFELGTEVREKVDHSPVTDADLAVEALIRGRLAMEFPDDGLLGEEFGSSPHGSERTWIIDPIDGTSYFARRDPNWRIHIALQVKDVLEVAVVAAPALGLRWWAHRDHGAFFSTWPDGRNSPTHLKVSTKNTLAGAKIAFAPEHVGLRVPKECVTPPRTPLPLVELVNGDIDGFVAEGYELWDHAPWILITQEAGGCFTDRQGTHSGAFGGGVYSNAALHPELVQSLGYGAEQTAGTDRTDRAN